MKTRSGKRQENKNQSVANEVSQKRRDGESIFQLIDNRPDAIAQRKLQEIANNIAQGRPLRDFQEIGNNSRQSNKATQLQPMDNDVTRKHESPIVQRKIHPPKPTHVTEAQVSEWNSLLEKWEPRLTGEEDWVVQKEVEMWQTGFNYALVRAALKTKIKAKINLDKLNPNDARGIGWGDILPLIEQIETKGICLVNISRNIDYDGSKGDTWYVKGPESGADQRGGWKYNAMKPGYLPSALNQVRTAIEIHNGEIDLAAAKV
jgi:hypothetical protein